mgnify:CR=1 FL=1
MSLPAAITLHRFDNRQACAEALAAHLASQLRQDLKWNQQASLILSGGSTPIPMFEALSREELDWSRVLVSLADDRWLPPQHADSNQGKVEQHLLQNHARAARWIPLWNPAQHTDEALGRCREQLRQLPSQLSAVVLGMGNDGHTASLFPCSEELASVWDSREDCEWVTPTSAPWTRMTLTPQRLLASAERILHLTGADKLDTLSRALAGNNRDDMPIRHFFQQDLRIFWAP